MLHFLSKAIILLSIVYINCEKKFFVIPISVDDCDPNIRIFDSELGPIRQIGPHHVALDIPHFVLKQTFTEPTKVTVVLEKHKSGDKWNFFAKKNFPGICGIMLLPGFPWSEAAKQFKPGQLSCPVKPLDVPIKNITFDGDVSQFFTLGEDDAGLYRAILTGTALVGIKTQPLGCMAATFKVEGFDE